VFRLQHPEQEQWGSHLRSAGFMPSVRVFVPTFFVHDLFFLANKHASGAQGNSDARAAVRPRSRWRLGIEDLPRFAG
jgi:hypothetical protein